MDTDHRDVRCPVVLQHILELDQFVHIVSTANLGTSETLRRSTREANEQGEKRQGKGERGERRCKPCKIR